VSELERVRRSADAVRAFQAVPPVMDILVREHFLTAIRRLGMLDVVEGGASAVTIAFVDLVASTRLAQRIPPSQLAAAFGEFERAATDAALARDCRVVKLIGDEVMIAGARAPDVLAVVAEVMAFADQHAVLTGARAGIASGYAIARDGDYFGPVVNVAARLAALAEGGDALVNDDAARVAASMGYATGDAEKRLLKGFDAPVAVTQVRLY
jgi:class 3 adenylate cyclase